MRHHRLKKNKLYHYTSLIIIIVSLNPRKLAHYIYTMQFAISTNRAYSSLRIIRTLMQCQNVRLLIKQCIHSTEFEIHGRN